MQNSTKAHWDTIFSTKADNEVGWFQPYPKSSVDFLDVFQLPLDANIIDIGAGNSRFFKPSIAVAEMSRTQTF